MLQIVDLLPVSFLAGSDKNRLARRKSETNRFGNLVKGDSQNGGLCLYFELDGFMERNSARLDLNTIDFAVVRCDCDKLLLKVAEFGGTAARRPNSAGFVTHRKFKEIPGHVRIKDRCVIHRARYEVSLSLKMFLYSDEIDVDHIVCIFESCGER